MKIIHATLAFTVVNVCFLILLSFNMLDRISELEKQSIVSLKREQKVLTTISEFFKNSKPQEPLLKSVLEDSDKEKDSQ